MLQLAILVLITLFGNVAYADEQLKPVRVFKEGQLSLNYQMVVLKDKTNQLTINQVVKQKHHNEFKRSSQEIINLSVTPHTYWVKFTLSYPAASPNTEAVKRWYLELNKSLVDTAELYSPNPDGSFSISISDLSIPLLDRYLVHVNSIFPLEMRLGEEATFYLKIRNKASTLQLSLILWDPSVFVERIAQEEFLFGLFYGSIAVLLLYNFFLFFSVRDTSYLYYVGYLGFVTLFQVLERGHGVLHMGPLFDVLGKEAIVVLVWMALWCGVQFFRVYMRTKAEHPNLDFWLVIVNNISLISIAITLHRNDYITVSWVSLCAMVILTVLFFSSIYIWRKGNEYAKYFAAAWTFNLWGFFIYALVVIDFLPSNLWTLNIPSIGIVLEALVLSFALAERIKHERRRQLYFDNQAMDNLFQYQSVFDNSQEGMYQINRKGLLVRANSSFTKMFGYQDVSTALKNGRTLMLALFESSEFLEKTFNESSTFSNQLFINNNQVLVNHRAKVIYDKFGKPNGVEGSLVNMSEVLLRETAIKAKLRARAEKDMAIQESEQKSQFLSIMSHHIRTPLTAIIGYGEVLQEEHDDKKARKQNIQILMDNSKVLLQLINDILDYSKIEANKLDIEVIPVDVISILTAINEEFSGKHKGHVLDIHFKYPLPERVMSDPTRILQILRTLSQLGINSTTNKVVTITLSYSNNFLLFEIVYNEKLISNNSLLKTDDLRLRLSEKMAELMGGKVTLSQETKSQETKGSQFNFTFKAILAEGGKWIDSPLSKGTGTGKADSKKPSPLHLTGTVLLAEDNIVNQKLITKVVEKTGLTVRVAEDGAIACKYCDQSLPGLILMDINMPNRNGIEATEYLRNKNYTIPIYALTAETDTAAINRALQAGCDGVLSKPLDKKKLYKILNQCFLAKSASISSISKPITKQQIK